MFTLKMEDHAKNLLAAMRNVKYDFTLLLGPQQEHLQCHRVVLEASSDWFRQALEKLPPDIIILPIPNVTLKPMKNILNFLYTGELKNLRTDNLQSTMTAALYLKIEGLFFQTHKNKPDDTVIITRKELESMQENIATDTKDEVECMEDKVECIEDKAECMEEDIVMENETLKSDAAQEYDDRLRHNLNEAVAKIKSGEMDKLDAAIYYVVPVRLINEIFEREEHNNERQNETDEICDRLVKKAKIS